MIELKNINISFENKTILKDTSLKIPTGTLTLICGPSGCGKSTLLNDLTMKRNLDDIEYYIDNQRIYDKDSEQYKNQWLTYIPQSNDLFHTSVEKNLKLFYAINPQNKNYREFSKHINDLLQYVNLDKKLKKRNIKKLSGGERKRVAIACALAKNTPVIILDEPDSNLDNTNQMMIAKVIENLVKLEKTVIIATHNEEIYTPDYIYRFENYQLHLTHGNLQPSSLSYQIDHHLKPKYRKIMQHQYRLSHALFSILIALGLSFASILGMMSVDVGDRTLNQYGNFTSEELLVTYR